MTYFERVGKLSSMILVVSVILLSVLSYFYPTVFAWLSPFSYPLYAISFFFIGTQISWSMVGAVRFQFRPLLIGLLSQCLIMPCIAFLIAQGVQLSPEAFLGFMLIACCPGGLATPLWVYLSRGDVPLTMGLKLVHTLLSPILIPVLFWIFTSQTVPIPVEEMFLLFSLVILLPFLLGISVGSATFKINLKRAQSSVPLLVIIPVCLTVSSSMAHADLSALWKITSDPLLLAVILLHLGGWLWGWGIARWLGCSLTQQITISLETPSRNTHLAIWIVVSSLSPYALVPIIVYHLWQYLAGSFVTYLFSVLLKRNGDLGENHSAQNK
ncbi:bile acid:sodium symporter family protein [Hazenella coriacea]|uniref:BASS family bile acid:Na+ symporter n=1 Tax=Hazenella coriacea TaxID=1179467 RepID=A0A4R3L9X4_9BACL|nr:bile acid:sodium symporter family protein [Hazenella coriacea]TCS96472.1 BASS family bile acid:Na+ symporter [Hazenella coriacea]